MNWIHGLIKRYKTMSVQARAALWYTFSNIVQKGISFFVVPIYVRLLTTAEYGRYGVFQSWKEILLIIATLNLYCGVFTKAMVDLKDDRDRYTSSMQGLSSLITTIILVIYGLNIKFWNELFDLNGITMILMFAFFYLYPAFQFWSVRQRVDYKYKRMVALTLVSALAAPLAGILLLYTTSLREYAVIIGYLGSQIIIGAIFYVRNLLRGRTLFVKEYWIHALKFNIPLIPHYLSLIVLGQSDRIMIKSICGEAKAGIYSLAYQVSMVMSIFVSAINNSYVPWAYEKLKNKDYPQLRHISNLLCLIVGLMTTGAILIAPEIIGVLGTKEYLEAIWVVPAVAGSAYFTFCYGLFSNVEFYYSSTHYVMIASVIGAVLNIALNAIFIPIYGFVAAGYTTLACYFVFMIMHYFFMKRTCIENGITTSVFDMRFLWISVIIIFALIVVCLLIYPYNYIRFGVIAIGGIIAIVLRNKILDIIKMLRRK